MKKAKFLALIILLSLSLPYTYGGWAGGGGGGSSGDPCAGPVPCLTTGFGNTFYEFVASNGDPVVVLSDGVNVGFGGIYYDPNGDPFVFALVGPVVTCHDGDLTDGYIDWNDNSIIDAGEELVAIDAQINICKNTLSIYNLVVLGQAWQDFEATYVGPVTLSLGTIFQQSTESQRTLLNELFQMLSIE